MFETYSTDIHISTEMYIYIYDQWGIFFKQSERETKKIFKAH